MRPHALLRGAFVGELRDAAPARRMLAALLEAAPMRILLTTLLSTSSLLLAPAVFAEPVPVPPPAPPEPVQATYAEGLVLAESLVINPPASTPEQLGGLEPTQFEGIADTEDGTSLVEGLQLETRPDADASDLAAPLDLGIERSGASDFEAVELSGLEPAELAPEDSIETSGDMGAPVGRGPLKVASATRTATARTRRRVGCPAGPARAPRPARERPRRSPQRSARATSRAAGAATRCPAGSRCGGSGTCDGPDRPESGTVRPHRLLGLNHCR